MKSSPKLQDLILKNKFRVHTYTSSNVSTSQNNPNIQLCTLEIPQKDVRVKDVNLFLKFTPIIAEKDEIT